jgi:hypothetical protein
MGGTLDQKAWLTATKRALGAGRPGGLTWEQFADLANVDPRTFKSYRLPEDSTNYRRMPADVEARIRDLVDRVRLSEAHDANAGDLVLPPLAAMVVRLARLSLKDNWMVCGITRLPGRDLGLDSEARRTMALVSRACLTHGFPDRGAEIHELLAACTRPFREWLAIPEVEGAGLLDTAFILGDEGVPAPEAEDLAKTFSSIDARVEEEIFDRMNGLLDAVPPGPAATDYTRTRELVVRNPVIGARDLHASLAEFPAVLANLVMTMFYSPVPESWRIEGELVQCGHCLNAMKRTLGGLVCRTSACASSLPSAPAGRRTERDLLRVRRGLLHYWVEPGFDEVRLYDALRHRGLPVQLYPMRDVVDLAVREWGVDLKAYASPETLGRRFRDGLGGLARYRHRILAIPDWLIERTPAYLERLVGSMGRTDVHCLSVSAALALLLERAAPADGNPVSEGAHA